jgi:outer membrane immunogenic protein
VAGGQIGFNRQINDKVILGAEADISYADINNKVGNNTFNSKNSFFTSEVISSNNEYERKGINWLGTVRARAGYDLGKFMPYITGGLAYGEIEINGNEIRGSLQAPFSQYISSFSSDKKAIQIGWAAGAGAEYKVSDNWSVRGEYLFTQLGVISYSSEGNIIDRYGCTNCIPPSTVRDGLSWGQGTLGPFGIHQARIGLNYQTKWLGITGAAHY